MSYINLKTGKISDTLPTELDAVKNPPFELCAKHGWRILAEVEQPPAGERIAEKRVVDVDGKTAYIEIVSTVNIAQEATEQAAREADALAAATAAESDFSTWTKRERFILSLLKPVEMKPEDWTNTLKAAWDKMA